MISADVKSNIKQQEIYKRFSGRDVKAFCKLAIKNFTLFSYESP